MLKCWNCHTVLQADTNFCFNCGSPQKINRRADGVDQRMLEELNTLLMKQLKQRATELAGRKQAKLLLKDSSTASFSQRINTDLISIFQQSRLLEPTASEAFVEEQFDKLIYTHLIREGQQFLPFVLSNQIPVYFTLDRNKINLKGMIFDFYDFSKEDSLTVYPRIDQIPEGKLKNAQKFFLKSNAEEELQCLVDIGVLGNCKEGFAITDQAFYWRGFLSKPKEILFTQLDTIQKVDDWLTINGHFFNVKKSVNAKTLLFLKTIKWLWNL